MPIGESKLSPVDIEDIAKVAVALMRSNGHQGKAFDMTGPEALSMQEVVEQISHATGTTFRYVEISLQDKLRELRDNAVPEHTVQIVNELLAERSRRPKSHLWLETHQAFDVKPTSFAEFAHRNAEAFVG